MPISNELIDQLLKDYHSPEDLLGESGLLKQLTQKLAERPLEAEMAMHLGYVKHDQIATIPATPATEPQPRRYVRKKGRWS